MLKIEKTLKELRDLQNTLHGLGIEMSIKDADAETKSDYEDAAMTIDIFEPCRCFAWVGMDGVIHQFPGGDARYFNAGRNRPLLSV